MDAVADGGLGGNWHHRRRAGLDGVGPAGEVHGVEDHGRDGRREQGKDCLHIRRRDSPHPRALANPPTTPAFVPSSATLAIYAATGVALRRMPVDRKALAVANKA